MQSFAHQITEHIPRLRRVALSLTRNADAADDLVQESVARALEKRHLFRHGTDLGAWLRTILHNLHFSELRRRNRHAVPTDPAALVSREPQLPNQESSVELKALDAALDSLPDDRRHMLISIGIDGASYERVAGEMGLPVGTVKSRVSRAREQVRGQIEGRASGRAHEARLSPAA